MGRQVTPGGGRSACPVTGSPDGVVGVGCNGGDWGTEGVKVPVPSVVEGPVEAAGPEPCEGLPPPAGGEVGAGDGGDTGGGSIGGVATMFETVMVMGLEVVWLFALSRAVAVKV